MTTTNQHPRVCAKDSVMWQRLFTPIRLGELELRNRIVQAPLATIFADENGAVTQRMIDYYVARARGGTGLQIVEGTAITQDREVGRLSIHDDQLISGLCDLAEAIKEAGGTPAIQLAIRDKTRYAASSYKRLKEVTRPMGISVAEIGTFVEAYALAARRVRAAGFQAVEVHAAHHTMIAQFLSPRTNHRTDEYGQDVEGRTRFLREILTAMREELEGLPLLVRLSGDEFAPGGLVATDAADIAARIQNLVEAVDVSAGGVGTLYWGLGPMSLPRGYLVHLAYVVKQAVQVPVIAVGRINNPELADRILVEGKADLIAMGRPLVADPDLPRKAEAGALDDIRPCIACNCCRDRVSHNLRLRCAVNPSVGRERDSCLYPAVKPKKVLVVGGGPGGLEAACVAKRRGHDVLLVEQAKTLGGQMVLASIPPHKDEIKGLLAYWSIQVRKLGVSVILGTAATSETVSQIRPDLVIVATGAKPLILDIPGIASGVASRQVRTAEEVLKDPQGLGPHVVVIGGAAVGCETAEFLAAHGHSVTIVEMLPQIAKNVEERTRFFLLQRLSDLKIDILTGTRIQALSSREVSFLDRDGKEGKLVADNVVLAAGYRPDRSLVNVLKDHGLETYIVGDCARPRDMRSAIDEGNRVAREV